jgi:hypothetical protein
LLSILVNEGHLIEIAKKKPEKKQREAFNGFAPVDDFFDMEGSVIELIEGPH